MKKYSLIALSLVFLAACSGSKQYYKPENTQKLTTIKTKNENILKNFKGYEIINKQDNILYLSNDLGFLKILKDKEVIFDKKFDAKIVSIATEGNKAVMVDALNNIIIFDLLEQKYLFSENYGQANGVVKKLANPSFNNNVIIIPSLDGKLIVINNNTNTFIRSINVGTQEFFNNVVFLKADSEKLIAASSSKVFTIIDNKTYTKLINIKKALEKDNYIYILSSEGVIYKFDYLLNEITKIKFKYANYSDVYVYNNFIYALEHNGYLIKLDDKLNELAVYNLDSKIDSGAYFKDNILFYNNKSYELK